MFRWLGIQDPPCNADRRSPTHTGTTPSQEVQAQHSFMCWLTLTPTLIADYHLLLTPKGLLPTQTAAAQGKGRKWACTPPSTRFSCHKLNLVGDCIIWVGFTPLACLAGPYTAQPHLPLHHLSRQLQCRRLPQCRPSPSTAIISRARANAMDILTASGVGILRVVPAVLHRRDAVEAEAPARAMRIAAPATARAMENVPN